MARTSFADPRENCARPAALAAFSRRLVLSWRSAASEDRLRMTMIMTAAAFASVAIAALHLPAEAVASALLATAVALVAIASNFPQRQLEWDGAANSSHHPMAKDASPLQSQLYTLLSNPRQPSQKPAMEWLDFTARMSHDLRTPLNAVIGFSELMASDAFGPLDPETCRAYARHIHTSGRALLKSAEDSLAITALLAAPPGALKPSALLLVDELQHAWHAAGTTASVEDQSAYPRLTLHGLDQCVIALDAQTFRRVMINLLTEASTRAVRTSDISITASVSQGQMKLSVAVEAAPPRDDHRHESISLCVARTLLALNDIKLTEETGSFGTWHLSFYLDCATQPDFFTSLPSRL